MTVSHASRARLMYIQHDRVEASASFVFVIVRISRSGFSLLAADERSTRQNVPFRPFGSVRHIRRQWDEQQCSGSHKVFHSLKSQRLCRAFIKEPPLHRETFQRQMCPQVVLPGHSIAYDTFFLAVSGALFTRCLGAVSFLHPTTPA